MKLILILSLFLTAFNLNAQVNAYARVTSISSTTINVSNPNETYGTFTSGNQVIVMQMQDNVIGSNTSDNSNFGNLSSISSTGMYEAAVISSVVRASGVVTQIVINSPLAQTYNTGSNRSVQIISFPLLGASGYTTTADISAVPWNGLTGGVVAFRVTGTLTLNHNITADNAGFRGGTINAGTAGSCDGTTYRIADNELNGNKGEGIYKATNTSYAAGRAKILNGGGGGNSHNGGGGGGSNITAGGEGGKGYSCSSNAGGLGGIALNSFVSADRVFMGGGGGSGEANNGYNTAGGSGGGIIIIKATQINTTGSGSALRISANGQTAANVGNDGAGGGGAGGSILLNVTTWNIVASKLITILSNGGSGGNVTDATAHGGGAGAGQGAIVFSTATPTGNITVNTLNGSGGRNYSGGTFAENGVGTNNTGIYNSSFSVLPVRLVFFKGIKVDDVISLEWKAVGDENADHFEIQRSGDGNAFQTIGRVDIQANNRTNQEYTYNDKHPRGDIVYYRLYIRDKDGYSELSGVVAIKLKKEPETTISLVPNPVRRNASLNINSGNAASGSLRIINCYGTIVGTKSFHLNKGDNKVQLINAMKLISGTYQVFVTVNNNSSVVKMLVQK